MKNLLFFRFLKGEYHFTLAIVVVVDIAIRAVDLKLHYRAGQLDIDSSMARHRDDVSSKL